VHPIAALAVAAVLVLPAGTRAQPTGFWGPPENLAEPVNSFQHELSGIITDSGRTLYFARNLAGQNDLYVSHREGDVWGRPLPLSALNTPLYNELNPTFSSDGSRIYFASDRADGRGGYDIWTSLWNGSDWSPPEPLSSNVNSSDDEWYAAPGPDGLYLSARTESGPNRGDILFAAGVYPTYAPRVAIPALATSFREMSAYPSWDGSRLHVVTNQAGTLGFDDLWISYREDSIWSAPVHSVCFVNTADYEQYPVPSPDELSLLFASYSRPEGLGGSDLYLTRWRALGDMNADLVATSADIVYLANYLFSQGPAPKDPLTEDLNCDGEIGLVDVVVLVNYVLRSGPSPCIGCAP
jgi:hypothetical protein